MDTYIGPSVNTPGIKPSDAAQTVEEIKLSMSKELVEDMKNFEEYKEEVLDKNFYKDQKMGHVPV